MTPKCVKSISPCSEKTRFPSAPNTVRRTLRSEKPCISAHSGSLHSSGTSEGRVGVTVWPAALAKRSPSPVEPVAG